MMPVILAVVLPMACLTALVLAACILRKGAVRGFLRAGFLQLSIEIDASPPEDRDARKPLMALPVLSAAASSQRRGRVRR
jgi:hypothetical protein